MNLEEEYNRVKDETFKKQIKRDKRKKAEKQLKEKLKGDRSNKFLDK